jgi:hypothetical protein
MTTKAMSANAVGGTKHIKAGGGCAIATILAQSVDGTPRQRS